MAMRWGEGGLPSIARHSRLGYTDLNSEADVRKNFMGAVKYLRKIGYKRISLKTGSYGMEELAMSIKYATDAKLDLLTIDGSGGGAEEEPEEQEEEAEAEEQEEEEAEEEQEEEEAEEEQEDMDEEVVTFEEFEYKGITYYKDSDGQVYQKDADGDLDDTPIGLWNEAKQKIQKYAKA